MYSTGMYSLQIQLQVYFQSNQELFLVIWKMNKKIERLITAGMIAGLVAVFIYQVAYGIKSGGYPIARYDKYDRMIITYQMGFQGGKQDGLNSVAE